MADQPIPLKPPTSPLRTAQGGGSYGMSPQFSGNMTFAEIGSLGLRAWSGWVREEFLPELIGRQGAQKYREMADNSPIVGAILYAIRSTMRKVEWRVTPAGAEHNKTTDPAAQEKADFVESLMHDMSHSWEDLVDENLSMLQYGYAPHEIVYKKRLGRDPGADPENPGEDLPLSEYDDGLIGWRRIPIRGQDTVLKWFFDKNGQIKGMTQMPWVGPMIDLPMEKLLLFRPSAHKNNPEGRSILRTSYLPYYFVKRFQEQEAIVGERLGGVPVLQVPGDIFENAATDANARAALETYKKIATNVRIDEQMGIVLPSDVWQGANGTASASKMFEFQLITPTGRPMGGFDFDKTITRYSTYMMTAVMADFLTLGHESRGTQSLAVTKVDMFFQAVEGFLNSMAGVYNRYALPRLWKLNGFDYELMPKIEPDLAQRVDLDVLSNFVLRMSQAGMPLFPNEDLQTYILDAGGLPDITEEEALQHAGMTADQLQTQDEKDQAMLENMKNPPMPGGKLNGKGPATPGRNKFEKMLLASVARRMIKTAGPKFGVQTHQGNKSDRPFVGKFNPHHVLSGEHGGEFTSGDDATLDSTRPQVVLDAAQDTAKKLGFDPSKIAINNGEYPFTLNGKQYQAAGLAYLDGPKQGTIELFPRQIGMGATPAITAHEVMHQKFRAYLDDYRGDREGAIKDISIKMRGNGMLDEEGARRYPIYQEHTRITEDLHQMMRDDGVSSYSRDWWNAQEAGTATLNQAIHETLSEIGAQSVLSDTLANITHIARAAPNAEGQAFLYTKPLSQQWKDLYTAVNNNWQAKHNYND